MTPFCGVTLVALNGAMVRVDACELYVFAEIVSAVHAKEAVTARDARLDCYTVTCDDVRSCW